MNDNISKPVNEKPIEKKSSLPYGYKMSREVGWKIFEDMCHKLGIDEYQFIETDEGEKTKNQLTHAFCTGHLEYTDAIFILHLKTPLSVGSKELSILKIPEPIAGQMRSMSQIKKKNDDFGKALAVLGDVTKLGLPLMNKMGMLDGNVAVSLISLFL